MGICCDKIIDPPIAHVAVATPVYVPTELASIQPTAVIVPTITPISPVPIVTTPVIPVTPIMAPISTPYYTDPVANTALGLEVAGMMGNPELGVVGAEMMLVNDITRGNAVGVAMDMLVLDTFEHEREREYEHEHECEHECEHDDNYWNYDF